MRLPPATEEMIRKLLRAEERGGNYLVISKSGGQYVGRVRAGKDKWDDGDVSIIILLFDSNDRVSTKLGNIKEIYQVEIFG